MLSDLESLKTGVSEVRLILLRLDIPSDGVWAKAEKCCEEDEDDGQEEIVPA